MDDALVAEILKLNDLDLQLFKHVRSKFCGQLNDHDLNDFYDATICHRPVHMLNGLQDPICPREPAAIVAHRYPQAHWPTVAHFVHVPKSGGSSFGRVVRRALCAANDFSEALDCCIADEDLWCNQGCPPPDCNALFGCRYCDCRHTPQLGYMDRAASITILRHPSDRAVSGCGARRATIGRTISSPRRRRCGRARSRAPLVVGLRSSAVARGGVARGEAPRRPLEGGHRERDGSRRATGAVATAPFFRMTPGTSSAATRPTGIASACARSSRATRGRGRTRSTITSQCPR